MDKKYICLRDDDTSYFTKPGELEYCYGRYWGKYPITLATIPFVHGSAEVIWKVEKEKDKYRALRNWEMNASAKELTGYHFLYPIGFNEELVAELSTMVNSGKIEIAQHGVNHRYSEFGPEMQQKNVLFRGIRDGKEYLEKVFKREIGVFVPPSNFIDDYCMDEIVNLNMQLLCCGSIQYQKATTKLKKMIENPGDTLKGTKQRILNKGWIPIRKRMGYEIVGSITYDPIKNYQEVKSDIRKALDEYGFVSICSHYKWLSKENDYCDKSYRNNYHKLIEELSEIEGVEFVCASAYINLLKEKLL